MNNFDVDFMLKIGYNKTVNTYGSKIIMNCFSRLLNFVRYKCLVFMGCFEALFGIQGKFTHITPI